ncbi:endonuclease/exonuclease/phosphatase [Podospora didyma]|uniref:Endonuclease/exonuclease/phosphatase n=1 Tax=Podospora didyma TaxID=330526 RepID=A0AAE0U4C9_9PEZI|nr:endonuclease/exonuclease/phosphatase [Podospora didyma]
MSTPRLTLCAPILGLITHNICYATSYLFPNERPWPKRRPLILSQLKHAIRPDSFGSGCFICLQEVLHSQLLEIVSDLNRVDRSSVGNTPTKGEYSPILYPVKLFNLPHYGTIWLSPTPDRPSKGWDAGSTRILTIGVFEHTQTKQTLVAANTHLDNAGSKSREKSVEIIPETLKRLGVFLAWDFNSLTAQETYIAVKQSGYWVDAHDEVEAQDHEESKDEQVRIDFLFPGPQPPQDGHENDTLAKESSGCKVDGYAVLPNILESVICLSDHGAVVGDFRLRYSTT